MTHFEIIFIVIVGMSGFGIWKGIKALKAYIKKYKPKVDDSASYLDGESESLPGNFNELVNQLEKQRVEYYYKTKGLFKRAFLKTWAVLVVTVFVVVAIINGIPEIIEIPAIIGPLAMTAFLSFVFSGIYTLFRKGTNQETFTHILKMNLIAKMASHVNPAFTFIDEGIEEDRFHAADLFIGKTFKSEDTIRGKIEGQNIVVSECHVETTHSRGKDSNVTYVYFNGLFLDMELKNKQLPNLKIIPKTNVKNEIKHESFSISKITKMFDNLGNQNSNHHYRTLKIHDIKDKVLKPLFDGDNYVVFGSEAAKAHLSSNFHKVIDFILAKFEYCDAFISIQDGHFYLAISWNQNMFDSNTILKDPLPESGLVTKIHQDLQFIDQIIGEICLMNKL
ncbi:MAG: DUF3137 domain-containing protein [Reichenbachiella sp.]